MPDPAVKILRAPDGAMKNYKLKESFTDHSEAYRCCEALRNEGKYIDVRTVHSDIEGFWAVYALERPLPEPKA